jgi:group I intron endonuclease
MIGIYKITSPSGKIYIGQSTNIPEREKHYKKKKCIKQPKIFNSLNKHGWDKHIFEIIEECHIDKLDEREIYWKQYYLDQVEGDWDKVLFCELYDNGGGPRNNLTRQKMSISIKKVKQSMSKDEKREMGDKIKEFHNNMTDEQRDDISEKLSNSLKSYYDNMTESEKVEMGNKIKNSRHNMTTKQKQDWKLKIGQSKHKTIIQYDLNNNIIKEWNSLKSASQSLNIKIGDISSVCRGKGKTAGGFIWKFK